MGSLETSIVSYGRSRSRSRSRSRRARRSPSFGSSRRRSPSYGGGRRRRSRSRSNSPDERNKTERERIADEKVTQQQLVKEQASARVESATKAVDAAQKSLEAAIAAELEATNKLQELKQDASKIHQEDRIQKVVDEREEARRAKNFTKAKDMQSMLSSMGVQVNDNDLTWSAAGGLSGQVKGGLSAYMRPGDWKCPACGVLVFSSKKVCNKCWKCGTHRDGGRRSPSARPRDRRDRGRRRRRSESSDDRRDRGRRSPSY